MREKLKFLLTHSSAAASEIQQQQMQQIIQQQQILVSFFYLNTGRPYYKIPSILMGKRMCLNLQIKTLLIIRYNFLISNGYPKMRSAFNYINMFISNTNLPLAIYYQEFQMRQLCLLYINNSSNNNKLYIF